MKYQAYKEYKDSGVEWLGEVPAQWKLCRLKFMAKIRNGQDYKAIEIENGYPVMGSGGQFTYASKFMYDQESVLLGRKGTIDKPLYINEPFWTVDTMYYTEISKEINAKYLYYLALTIQFDRYSTNTALPSMTQENLGNFTFSVPNNQIEREQIANFLDHETAKIDTLIEKQQQLIKLLKEKRQAVISHAVTKGLNPTNSSGANLNSGFIAGPKGEGMDSPSSVPMRDSGVEWLGEVPGGWDVSNMSYVLKAIGDVDHYMPKSVEKGIPYVMTGDLKELASSIKFNDCKQVNHNDYLKLSKKIKSSKGDVIMARYATIGTVSYIDLDTDFLVSYSCVTIKANISKVIGLYLFYYFKSDAFLQGIQSQVNTNTQENVGINDLKKIKVALPTLAEQSKIIEYLQSKISKLDSISDRAQAAITLAQERRTALISAAVTGKIDVRHHALHPAGNANNELERKND